MHPVLRSVAFVAVVVLVPGTARLAVAKPTSAQKCAAAKRKLAAKKIAGLTACDAKGVAKGVAPDDVCLTFVTRAFTTAWGEAEAKGGCMTTQDVATIEAKVDAHRTDLGQTLVETGAASKCTGAKVRAAGKKALCQLGCSGKAALKGLALTDVEIALCLQKCSDKFTKAFAAAEKLPATAKNGSCHTTGDAAAIETKIDAFVEDVTAELPGGTSATAPHIDSVQPTSGREGDTFTFFGMRLVGSNMKSDVRVHGVPAVMCTGDAESRQCNVAAGTPVGQTQITDKTTGGTASIPYEVLPPVVSRRSYKSDIAYLTPKETTRLHDQLLQFKLATYRYKTEDRSAASHLGFIIDDVGPGPAVGQDGDHVDLYGYSSMAVAAIQTQARQIEQLQREVEELRRELRSRRRAGG
jgi:hypothetical protein